ncbi:hypothetical protein ALMP_51870 [Streptomyces sp. A012304]|nr:hypothetical protein ALMP_51870 [Streptomyces sp. A012304]
MSPVPGTCRMAPARGGCSLSCTTGDKLPLLGPAEKLGVDPAEPSHAAQMPLPLGVSELIAEVKATAGLPDEGTV